jgi:ABC-type branched-subunit amino acid transport system ATPase component
MTGTFAEDVEGIVAELRPVGREIAGFGGTVDRRPMRRLLREERASAYPAVALFALSVSDLLHGSAFSVLQPDIGRTFGIGPQFFTVINLATQVTALLLPLAVARFVQNRARRAMVALVTAGIWSVLTAGTAMVVTVSGLGVMMLLDTASTSANGTVQGALLIDSYPPQVRVRVVSLLRAGGLAAGLAAPALVAVLTSVLHLNWRGVFLVLGGLAILSFLVALGLRDPGYGRWDTQRIQDAVQTDLATGPTDAIPPAHLTIGEALRRIVSIPSMRLFLWAGFVASIATPISVYLSFYYADRFNLDATDRALLQLGTGAIALASITALSGVGDRIYQRSPRLIFLISGGLSIVGIGLTAAQVYVSSVGALVTLSLIGAALGGLVGPAQMVGTMSLVPAPLRPHVGAVTALFGLGGLAVGTILLGGLTSSVGLGTAVIIASLPAAVGAVVTMRAGHHIKRDLDRTVEETIETEAVAQLRRTGRDIPVVSCKGLDFAYGPLQVLFGVDFSVEAGEMVALLGVNGAGKSTLLRAISGLGIPSRGSVRLNGQDVTFLDAERRCALGIAQVPGGRAVFAELSVVDNLRCYAYGLHRSRRAVSGVIDTAFEAFPELAARSHQPAAVLSGGEQQMLALSKALILRPQVLLVDELSLGLAPAVVERLIAMVRRINADGTAVVLVEQSVNLALSIAEHAYFMERGRVRFDGNSAELLRHDDLLRAVFLDGASA